MTRRRYLRSMTRPGARFKRAVVTTCLTTFLGAPAGAQGGQRQAPDLFELTLEELLNIKVTTATRTSERLRDVPARIEVVTADQITRRGYRSLAQLLSDLPGFKVETGADQDLPVDMVVQGTRGSSRIVVLLDGIRISSPTNEPLPILANYPVHSARQVEIVYGPGSALYGADAFSAVVNIISKDAGQAEGLTLASSVGQFGISNTSGTYAARLGDRASLLVAGQLLHDRQPNLPRYYPDDFGGMRAQQTGMFNTIFGPMTSSSPVPPQYENPMSAHSFQAAFHVGGLALTLFQNSSRMPTAPANTPENAVYSDEASNRNNLLMAAGQYTRTVGRVEHISTVMMSRHELDPQSGYRNVYSNMDRSYKYGYGSMWKAEHLVSWKPAPALTLTSGATVERFFSIPQGADVNAPVQSRNAPGTILGTGIPDEFFKLRYGNIGAYLQAQYAVTPALALTVGGRADHNTRYGRTANPRMGLVWHPSNRSDVKLLYGTAFLAPSPYQAYAHYGSFYSTDDGATYASSFWHLPNPELRPQLKSTTELSARLAIFSAVDVWGTAFYSRFSDLIREGPDRSERYAGFYHAWPVDFIEISVNEGRQRTYGGSVGAEALRSFSADRQIAGRVALSWTDGYVGRNSQAGRLEIGGMAPVQLHLGADVGWDRWSVAPRLLVVGRQRVLAMIDAPDGRQRRRTLDGYAALDLHVRRENLFRHISVFATVENALDRRYRNINLRAYTNPEELIGAPQNPRRVTVGIEVQVP